MSAAAIQLPRTTMVPDPQGIVPGQAPRDMPPTPEPHDAMPDPVPNEAPDDMPLGQVEEQICTLAGQVAAATCRLLLLLASFDTREGWGGAGMRSCAHWLSWRCGLGLSTAHEHLRVAHALTQLPATTAEFAAGRLSYAKIRAITRVAAPDTETELVEIALNAPAAHVERLVRGLRRAASLVEDAEVAARAEHRYRWDHDGTLVVTLRLTAEDGATYLAALNATRDALDERRDPPPASTGESPAGDDSRRTGPAEPDQLDQPTGPTGPTGPDQPTDCEQSPAGESTTLVEAFVAMAETSLAQAPGLGATGRRAEVVVHVDVDVLCAATDEPVPTSASTRCNIEDGPGLLPEVVRALACDGGIVTAVHDRRGRTLDVGRRRRRPSAAILRALWLRDQGCIHPGCGRRRHLHAHHVVHWAHGGKTSLSNLVLLCGRHHRALHHGKIDVHLVTDGVPSVTTPTGDLAPAPDVWGSIHALNTAYPEVTSSTTTPRDWHGEPLRLGEAVTALLGTGCRRIGQ